MLRLPERRLEFTQAELMVLSRDLIGALRDKTMITAGQRSPTPGAPFTYVTTHTASRRV